MALRDMDKFNDIVEEMKDLVRWYETTNFKDKKMRLHLTNSESFVYTVPEDKIAHLLGVNITNLQSLGIYKNISSYGLLKEFLRDSHRISDRIRTDNIKLDYIFSKQIDKKIDNFKRNININLSEISFVCKYDRKKAYNDGKNTINCDYSIIKILEDGTILELDLVLSTNGKYLYPVSNKMYTDEFEAEEKLKQLLENQEIAMVLLMTLYNNEYDSSRRIFLKDNEKIEKIDIIKKIREKYNCHIDLIDECERLYKRTNSNHEKNFNNYNIYDTIIECIMSGKLIDTRKMENLTIQQYDLIDAINDNLFSNDTNSKENQESYSKLRKSVESLREAKRTLIEEKKELEEKIKEQQQEIKTLKNDNELKDNLINSITTSFNDYNEKVKQKNI